MYTESVKMPTGEKREVWRQFLARAGLKIEEDTHQTVMVWDGDELIATGSRKGHILKCIAVDPARQGEGLTASVLTALKQEAHAEGHSHLFLYTKPRNRMLFEPLFFYPVAQTRDVLLMESVRGGIQNFLKRQSAEAEKARREGKRDHEDKEGIGAIVMNANPFTEGHRYLAKKAAEERKHVYIFVLSEDKSEFSAADRLAMVKAGTADLENVTVLTTEQYLISEATFPKYFLKDTETAQRAHYELDLAVFTKWFVPHFGITHRYAGTEPTCVVTAGYNKAMEDILPQAKVQFRQIQRLELEGSAISASIVRKTFSEEIMKKLVPVTTLEYMKTKNLFKGE